ncbi:MAG: hypothetical protein ACI4QC_04385 [Thermoguttaceae bacterium]
MTLTINEGKLMEKAARRNNVVFRRAVNNVR